MEGLWRFWRPRIATLGCAISLALAAGLALAPTAGAATRGFRVVNLTGATWRLYGARCNRDGGGCFEGRPDDGAPLAPGLSQGYQLVYYFFANDHVTALYHVANDRMDVDMNVNGFGESHSTCTVTGNYRCDAGADTITLLDPPGTVHKISSGQGQAQGAVLKQLCVDVTAAKCTFRPSSQTQVDSPSHAVGNALINSTDEAQSYSVSVSDTVKETNSVNISIAVKFKLTAFGQELENSITASYGHIWETSHAFTQTVTVKCPAYHRCLIFATQPMYRTTGNFTLTMGNTTWHLDDVSFLTPNPDGTGAYQVTSEPVKRTTQATMARSVGVAARSVRVVRRSDQYAVPSAVDARPTADARLRDASLKLVAGPRYDRDLISVTPVQPANRLVYPVDDVDVRVWADGHRVAARRIARLAFDHSKRLAVRVPAPAPAGGKLCVTVLATAPHAIPGRLRTCTADSPSKQ